MSAPETSALIEMHGICKVFRAGAMENHVLTEIRLDVRQGEFLAIAGPSGCGKTTLLSIMGLLDTPSSGELRFEGTRVDGLDRQARARLRNRHIGFVFQAFNLIGDLSVAENVMLPLRFRQGIGYRERVRRAEEALASVGMAHRMRHYPSQLSGGQQQRVAVARALAGDPAILLADEPTGNLDQRHGDMVIDLLHRLHAAGRTVCMVTHDERFRSGADRTVFLLDGHVVHERSFREMRRETDFGMNERRFAEVFP